jgi:hypothetical protein
MKIEVYHEAIGEFERFTIIAAQLKKYPEWHLIIGFMGFNFLIISSNESREKYEK